MDGQLTAIQSFAVWVLPVLFAITVHEAMHGFTAYLLGDKTAFILGRLTLNPIKHIDPIGTIVVPALLYAVSRFALGGGFIFGWAKPVPISERNFKHPRRDMALVALSGPMANFVMALLWGGIAKLGVILLHHGFAWSLALVYMGQAGIIINTVLMVLNLLPLPPLDGGHIMAWLLPKKLSNSFAKIGPYGFFILLFLLITGFLSTILSPLISIIHGTIIALFGI
jgi:Zn-dependent protease